MAKSTAIQPQPQTLSHTSRVALALTEANCFRGAEVTEAYLKLFAESLSKENPERLFQALCQLGEKPRSQGEPLLLSLGMILQEIKWSTEDSADER